MQARGGAPGRGRRWRWLAIACLLATSACRWLPAEFNLSPLYRQRLDPAGTLLELDVLWPIFHYERRSDGGDDFRIRPVYRYVREGETQVLPATEHQFLWPLGLVRQDREQSYARLFPLFDHTSRLNQDEQRETDWYFLFPFFWGGSRQDGAEDYLAVFPLFADIPNFLTYDRFRSVLFPLYLETHKLGKTDHILFWPLLSWGGNESGSEHWFRFLPLYGEYVREDRWERYTALWPFVHWGVEALGTDHEYTQFFLWPLYGRRSGERVHGWTVLWPFFQMQEVEGRSRKLDLFWPLIRSYEFRSETSYVDQWWFWPLYAETETERQRSWSMLWPLVWFREYDDPDGIQTADWVLPVYWRVHRARRDGTEDDFVKIWPFAHTEQNHDGTGETAVFSPWPWRSGNARGVQELYGWIWTLARDRWLAEDDHVFELMASLYTERNRSGRTQWSVPFLFSFDGDGSGGTLRLLQLLPIRFGAQDGAARAAAQEPR